MKEIVAVDVNMCICSQCFFVGWEAQLICREWQIQELCQWQNVSVTWYRKDLQFYINSEKLEKVNTFVYLGRIFIKDEEIDGGM